MLNYFVFLSISSELCSFLYQEMSHGPYDGQTLNSFFLFASPCLSFKFCYLIILILAHVSLRLLIRYYQTRD